MVSFYCRSCPTIDTSLIQISSDKKRLPKHKYQETHINNTEITMHTDTKDKISSFDFLVFSWLQMQIRLLK